MTPPGISVLKPEPGRPARLKYLPVTHPETTPEEAAEEMHRWLGPGSPLPPRDPSTVCCFVTIPGSGTTALTSGESEVRG